MKQQGYPKYFSRLMRIYILIFTIIIVLFGFLAILFQGRWEDERFLARYDSALVQLSTEYDSKHNEFYRTLLPLFHSTRESRLFSQFLNNPQEPANIHIMEESLQLLQQMVSMDQDIRSIILYKGANQAFYAYSQMVGMLDKVSADYAFAPALTESQKIRHTLGTEAVNTRPYQSKNNNYYTRPLYGIASTSISQITPSGIAIGYDTKALSRSLEDAALHPDARFFITTLKGNIIFDSKHKYASQGPTLFPYMAEITAPENAISLQDVRYHKEIKIIPQRDYAVFYYIPEHILTQGKLPWRIAIASVVIFFVLLVSMLSAIMSRLTQRRMTAIEQGMKQIGVNRLDYRIPLDKREDDFAQIMRWFNEMSDNLQQQIEQTYVYELRQKTAEFHALQTSINPHFLYNTLESMRERLYDMGDKESAEMILLLSRLFEYQIRGHDFVTLEEEIESLDMYVEFFSIRYQDSFSYGTIVPQELLRYGIPKHSLQPVLENYFIYGMQSGTDNEVVVVGRREGNDILIEIADNGKGISPDNLKELQDKLNTHQYDSDSMGLLNVAERLRIAFGDDYGLTIHSGGIGHGTVVELRLRAASVKTLMEPRLKSRTNLDNK